MNTSKDKLLLPDNGMPLSGRGGARATLDRKQSIPPPRSAPMAGYPAGSFDAGSPKYDVPHDVQFRRVGRPMIQRVLLHLGQATLVVTTAAPTMKTSIPIAMVTNGWTDAQIDNGIQPTPAMMSPAVITTSPKRCRELESCTFAMPARRDNGSTLNGRPGADHAFELQGPYRRAGPFQRLVMPSSPLRRKSR